MKEMKIPTVPPEEAHQLALVTWGQMYDASFQALSDKLGKDEALKLFIQEDLAT